jgi:hypothetical protein
MPHVGLEPAPGDLQASLGVVLALHGRRLAGVLAICPYSENQVTLWGPVIPDAREQPQVMPYLMQEVRRALRDGGFASMRALVDLRNRTFRAWMMAEGFTPWKDDHCFELDLAPFKTASLEGVQAAARADLDEVAHILAECFPDSDHHHPNLVQRENEGYRHYLLRVEGRAVGGSCRAKWWPTRLAQTHRRPASRARSPLVTAAAGRRSCLRGSAWSPIPGSGGAG